ncbi:Lachesin like protein [Argiope bruennichi]|uniref:Lachesin like protein n=1 Tax=Argiope bruennichi TaxID=94029 RepID=A0A8T0ES11_ARGBR|nr:Lachesin like protein [Argiope bruennichi]
MKCPPKNVQQNNRSMCCSFGIHNSSHSQNPCTLVNQGMSSAQHTTPSYRPPPSDCVLRIPVVRRKRPVATYDLLSCEGSTLHLLCEANVSCSDQGISWRKEGRTFAGRELRLQNVQRRDSGTYLCEVTDYYGRPRLGAQVTVAVQFPPVILVPKPSLSSEQKGDVLECSTEASPSATISWYRDDVPLDADDSGHSISSDTTLCTTRSRLLILLNVSSPSIPHNYTCVASNLHGRSAVTLLLLSATVESSSGDVPPEKRQFNVTGFIVGMLPPLFISFYIILKLGYRSRYAEERGEDDGFREEPFFISY